MLLIITLFIIRVCSNNWLHQSNEYCVTVCAIHPQQRPNVTSIHPAYGPMAGGTEIFIRGQNLFVGGRRKVMINNLECPVDSEKRYDRVLSFCFSISNWIERLWDIRYRGMSYKSCSHIFELY